MQNDIKLTEALILAGGLGTRLRSAVEDRPKAMALINGKPFLAYLLDYWLEEGIERFILSVGYKAEMIVAHFGDNYRGAEIVYAVEDKPLGTGGAVKNALQYANAQHVLVLNGDSMFRVSLADFSEFHFEKQAEVSVGLKKMQDFDRYGIVSLSENQRINGFLEKQYTQEGLINGGVYALNKDLLTSKMPDVFSLEKDFFEAKCKELKMFGFEAKGYFMDIGIPADYVKAQTDFSFLGKRFLFLDRDGVINQKVDGDYVRHLPDFHFLPNALSTIVALSKYFERIFVVTNQQGIAKELMSATAVDEIHSYLKQTVENAGGKIDAIYVAPQLASENSAMRKPNIGMALQAQADFPEIDFSQSLMIGDSESDRQFALNCGMEFIKVESKAGLGSANLLKI